MSSRVCVKRGKPSDPAATRAWSYYIMLDDERWLEMPTRAKADKGAASLRQNVGESPPAKPEDRPDDKLLMMLLMHRGMLLDLMAVAEKVVDCTDQPDKLSSRIIALCDSLRGIKGAMKAGSGYVTPGVWPDEPDPDISMSSPDTDME
jgi:hypothetical protein